MSESIYGPIPEIPGVRHFYLLGEGIWTGKLHRKDLDGFDIDRFITDRPNIKIEILDYHPATVMVFEEPEEWILMKEQRSNDRPSTH